MIPVLHRFIPVQLHRYKLAPATLRDRIIAQLIDGIILGVVCSLTFYFLSGGKIFSLWVSPMLPQYVLQVAPGVSPRLQDWWWGGYYYSLPWLFGDDIHLNNPAPLLWLIYGGYYTFFTFRLGQTPGKMMKRLVVLNARERLPSFKTSFVRWLLYVLSFVPFGLGFWWSAWEKKHRTWQDRICNTRVYYFE